MAAPRTKRHWFETGVSMIVIDTLVHNFLHRTGILRRSNSEHAYGPACYQPGGSRRHHRACCEGDRRSTVQQHLPANIPAMGSARALSFCAQEHLDICNGNQIDDSKRCRNAGCVVFHGCDRVALMT